MVHLLHRLYGVDAPDQSVHDQTVTFHCLTLIQSVDDGREINTVLYSILCYTRKHFYDRVSRVSPSSQKCRSNTMTTS